MRAGHIKRVNVLLQPVIRHGNRVGIERIRLDDIGAGLEILPVNGLHNFRLRDIEQIVVLAQVFGMIQELRAAKGFLVQLQGLNHGAHGAVDNGNPLRRSLDSGELIVFAIQRLALSLPHRMVSRARGGINDCFIRARPFDEKSSRISSYRLKGGIKEIGSGNSGASCAPSPIEQAARQCKTMLARGVSGGFELFQ